MHWIGRSILNGVASLWRRLRWIRLHCSVRRFGSEYGGFAIAPATLGEGSIIYSVGVGDDASFDLALIDHLGATIHAFDPTPRSVMWVERQTLPDRFKFHKWGVSDVDGTAIFAEPENATHISYRMVLPVEEVPAIGVPCEVVRVSTIMARLTFRKPPFGEGRQGASK